VALYSDGNIKLKTSDGTGSVAAGINVTGTVTATSIALNGNMETDGNITIQNGHELRFEQTDGTESFSIKTSGTTTNLLEQGGGNLNIKGDAVVIHGNNRDLSKITVHDEGGVKIDSELSTDTTVSYTRIKVGNQHTGTRFYCGTDETNVRAEVVSAGLNVNGTVTADGLSLGDDETITLGASNALTITHKSSNGNSTIKETGSGNLILQADDLTLEDTNSNKFIKGVEGGAVQIWHNAASHATAKLATTATGIDVNGNITVSGTVDGQDVADIGTKATTAHGWGNHASAGYLTSVPSTITASLTHNIQTGNETMSGHVGEKTINTATTGSPVYTFPDVLIGDKGKTWLVVNAGDVDISCTTSGGTGFYKLISGVAPASSSTVTVAKGGVAEFLVTDADKIVVFGSGLA